jgi:hypothetical protein
MSQPNVVSWKYASKMNSLGFPWTATASFVNSPMNTSSGSMILANWTWILLMNLNQPDTLRRKIALNPYRKTYVILWSLWPSLPKLHSCLWTWINRFNFLGKLSWTFKWKASAVRWPFVWNLWTDLVCFNCRSSKICSIPQIKSFGTR